MQNAKLQRTTPMKQIFLYASLAVMAFAAAATGTAPEPCSGTVLLTGMSNFQVRQADSQTFVEFDFVGLHDICLADHYGGGTLGYRGEASLTGGNWRSQVMTVGAGTGSLAGIRGQGTFWFTGPTSLADVIYYVYMP
jgi:hypothetical protein